MGFTRNLLSSRQLDQQCTFYTDLLRIDIAETIHVHFKNSRLSLSPEEFSLLTKSLFRSFLEWHAMGRPRALHPDHFVQWVTAKIDPLPPDDFMRSRGDELSVELQQQADYIHIHYRHTRLELSIKEFQDFSETIGKARRNLDFLPYIKNSPRRSGTHHGSNPRGRVTPGPALGFWLNKKAVSYLSMIEGSQQLPCQEADKSREPSLYRRILHFLVKKILNSLGL